MLTSLDHHAHLELFRDASGTLDYGIYYAVHWIADNQLPALQNRSTCGDLWSGSSLFFTAVDFIFGPLAHSMTPNSSISSDPLEYPLH